jgi:hypothetical protein
VDSVGWRKLLLEMAEEDEFELSEVGLTHDYLAFDDSTIESLWNVELRKTDAVEEFPVVRDALESLLGHGLVQLAKRESWDSDGEIVATATAIQIVLDPRNWMSKHEDESLYYVQITNSGLRRLNSQRS